MTAIVALLRAQGAQLYTGDRSSHKPPHLSHAKPVGEIKAALRNVLTVRLAVRPCVRRNYPREIPVIALHNPQGSTGVSRIRRGGTVAEQQTS